jgi:hypothetical protein
MKLLVLAVAGTAVIALAGCGGGDTGGRPAASSSAGGAQDAAGLRAAAQCMRANGYPNFPDPVENDGRWTFPLSGDAMPTPPAACMAMFDANKHGGPGGRERTGEDMAKLRQFADCVRKNGVPDWPDPDDSGKFQPPARINPDQDPAFRAAYRTCEQYVPSGGIDVGGTKPQHS